ncbi:MAG: DUF4468 domain-containing protein [Saprospiraceae bacterium]
MKNLFTILLLLIGSACSAQKGKNEIPLKDGLPYFSKVYKISSVDQKAIYNKCKLWHTNKFNGDHSVAVFDDSESRTTISRLSTTHYEWLDFGKTTECYVTALVKTTVSAQDVTVEIYDFNVFRRAQYSDNVVEPWVRLLMQPILAGYEKGKKQQTKHGEMIIKVPSVIFPKFEDFINSPKQLLQP